MAAYSATMAEPSFSIPVRPTRTYPYSEGVEYEGGTRFRLVPEDGRSNDELAALTEAVLDAGPYRYGDFLALPMPLYLVRDDGTGDVFRVSVRDGAIRFHVLPETEPAGLRAMYERLAERSETGWHVERETDEQA